MAWFVLPDKRVVAGGVQTILPDEATDKYPAGQWACWRMIGRSGPGLANGRTPVSEVIILNMDQGSPSPQGLVQRPCAICNDTACESNDFICVFCRYQDGL